VKGQNAEGDNRFIGGNKHVLKLLHLDPDERRTYVNSPRQMASVSVHFMGESIYFS